jgi:hypothetical protein
VKKADDNPSGSPGAPGKLFAEHRRLSEVFGDPTAWPNAVAANDNYAPRRISLLQRLLLLRRRQALDHSRADECGA